MFINNEFGLYIQNIGGKIFLKECIDINKVPTLLLLIYYLELVYIIVLVIFSV